MVTLWHSAMYCNAMAQTLRTNWADRVSMTHPPGALASCVVDHATQTIPGSRGEEVPLSALHSSTSRMYCFFWCAGCCPHDFLLHARDKVPCHDWGGSQRLLFPGPFPLPIPITCIHSAPTRTRLISAVEPCVPLPGVRGKMSYQVTVFLKIRGGCA